MQWLERSRWTTSPYYALVIIVIACGSIPKGMQLTANPCAWLATASTLQEAKNTKLTQSAQ